MYISKDPRIATYQKKIMYWYMSCEQLLPEIEKAERWLEEHPTHPRLGEARDRYETMKEIYDGKLEKVENMTAEQIQKSLL